MGHIIGPVLTVTVFSAGVVYAHDNGKSVILANSVTPLLAVVVSYSIVEDVVYDTYNCVMALGWTYTSVQVSRKHGISFIEVLLTASVSRNG